MVVPQGYDFRHFNITGNVELVFEGEVSLDGSSSGGGINILSGSLAIKGGSINNCVANSSSKGGAVNIPAGALLNVDGTVFQNNNAGILGFGGSINNEGTLEVANASFSGGSSSVGGAVYSLGAASFSNTSFSGNGAGNGGAIYGEVDSDISVISSSFSSNSASAGAGAAYVSTKAVFDGCVFDQNTAANGGALLNKGFIHINDTYFQANSSTGDGGAVYNEGNLLIEYGSFNGDSASASNGGAIYNTGSAGIANSTFWDNRAGDGSAVLSYGHADIISTTIAGGVSSGGASLSAGQNGSVSVYNSIIIGGSSSDVAVAGGASVSMGYSVYGSATGFKPDATNATSAMSAELGAAPSMSTSDHTVRLESTGKAAYSGTFTARATDSANNSRWYYMQPADGTEGSKDTWVTDSLPDEEFEFLPGNDDGYYGLKALESQGYTVAVYNVAQNIVNGARESRTYTMAAFNAGSYALFPVNTSNTVVNTNVNDMASSNPFNGKVSLGTAIKNARASGGTVTFDPYFFYDGAGANNTITLSEQIKLEGAVNIEGPEGFDITVKLGAAPMYRAFEVADGADISIKNLVLQGIRAVRALSARADLYT